MLFLVGIGLSDKDLSLKAVEVCKGCELFIDRYTSHVDDAHVELLKRLVGRQIKELGRQELEEGARDVVGRAKLADIAVLTGGDPLMATTHKILFIEAKKQDVKIDVVHSASAISAAMGESGLDIYRFGQITTIPRWSDHYKPVSFYEVVRRNMLAGLHSLLLLDYRYELGMSLGVREAIETLLGAARRYDSNLITESTKVLVMNNIASGGVGHTFTALGKAARMELGGVSILIIPAELSDIEREALESMVRVVD